VDHRSSRASAKLLIASAPGLFHPEKGAGPDVGSRCTICSHGYRVIGFTCR
jgi:hypothetical protein